MSAGKARVATALRQLISEQAAHRCGYCLCPQELLGMRMTVDHVTPEAVGGATVEENLWLACRRCNEFKGTRMEARDPETGLSVQLFHPRRDKWHEHFGWSSDGSRIIGVTACGRATCEALHLNNAEIIVARRHWVAAGWWPPRS